MDASKINVLPRVEEPAVVKKGIEYATALRPVAAWNYEEIFPIVVNGNGRRPNEDMCVRVPVIMVMWTSRPDIYGTLRKVTV